MEQRWQAHAEPGGFTPKAVNYLHKAFKQRGIALHTGARVMQLQARTLRALLAGQVPPTFHFVYVFRNISLGRHDGLIQFVDRRDRPRRVVWTGSIAAAGKEYVCRSTLTTVGLDAATRPPAMPPLRMLLQLRQGLRPYTFSAQQSCTCTRERFS